MGPKCTDAFEISSGSGHGTPTTFVLAVAITNFGLDGRNVDLVQNDAPFRSYLTSCSGHVASKVLSGTGIDIART